MWTRDEGALKWKSVHHMSRSLVKSEKNYKKVEEESLAIYIGLLMNRRYLIGTQFIIMTDQSTFQALYNNMGRMVPHRGQIGAFNMQVEYVPEDKNPCDYSSRHLDLLPENLTREQKEEIGIETEEEDKEICVRHVLQTTVQVISMEKLKDVTEKDTDLLTIMKEKQGGTKSKKASKGPCRKV